MSGDCTDTAKTLSFAVPGAEVVCVPALTLLPGRAVAREAVERWQQLAAGQMGERLRDERLADAHGANDGDVVVCDEEAQRHQLDGASLRSHCMSGEVHVLMVDHPPAGPFWEYL